MTEQLSVPSWPASTIKAVERYVSANTPQWATRTLSSAEILALTAASVEIVPTPGAGKFLVPLAGVVKLHPGTTPYVGDASTLSVGYCAETGFTEGFTAVWDCTRLQGPDSFAADWLAQMVPMVGRLDMTQAQSLYFGLTDGFLSGVGVENTPLAFVNPSGVPLTDGDGTLTISVLYVVLASSALV